MEPEIVDEIYQVISNVERVSEVTEVRVRWLGHRLYAEVNIAVDPLLSVAEGHEIVVEVRHRMIHNLGPFKRSRTCGSTRIGWGSISQALGT